jgi:tryptophan-rich sensory protein
MGRDIIRFILGIVICLSAGFIGSVFTTPQIPSWYAALSKPAFTPPGWVFAPVWTILYLMMGVALFLVWRKWGVAGSVSIALWAFGVQLVLNVLWSAFFFGLQSPVAGFVEILFLWIAIVVTILLFYRISRISAILLVPYLLWVSYAAVLTFSIWRMNL